MIREHDQVALTEDLPEHRLRRGDIGTVVHEHAAGGYEVEFIALNGATLLIATLLPHQVRPLGDNEIAQARALETEDRPQP